MNPNEWRLLLRPRLLALNSLAAFTGGLLFSASLFPALGAAFAVTVLATGATLLNQWQERPFDRLMQRTRQRPLVTGKISPRSGLLWGLILVLLGLGLLSLFSTAATIAGLCALLLYNGLYTQLKRRSFLALVPGALCGALPVVIGWIAAGGPWSDFRILLVAGLIVLWQLPHFWLLAWRYRDDYREAGLPQLHDRLDDNQMARLSRAWLWCLIPAALLLPLFHILQTFSLQTALILGLFLYSGRLIRQRNLESNEALKQQFIDVNLLMLLLLILLTLDCLLR